VQFQVLLLCLFVFASNKDLCTLTDNLMLQNVITVEIGNQLKEEIFLSIFLNSFKKQIQILLP